MEIEAPVSDEARAPAVPAARARTAGVPSILYRYREWALVLALTSAGAFVRLWHLTTLPNGFHNDEGNVFLDAQQILHHGWIGVYSGRANGYPIAANYWIAPFIKLIDNPVLAVRLPIALLGIACIPLMYLVARNAAGWRVATCAAILLAFSLWHLHLSRVGFPVMGWPLAELASLVCLHYGMKQQRWPWFVAAGLLIGVQAWIYNSAFLFVLAAGIYLGIWYVARNTVPAYQSLISFARRRTWHVGPLRELLLLLILLGSTLFAAAPLIRYQQAHRTQYDGHFKAVYIFDRPEYTGADLGEKLHVTEQRVQMFYRALTNTISPDGADGLGTTPPVGRLTMYLALFGAGLALWRARKPAFGIGLLVVPLLVISTALTVDGQYRRSFGLIPFIALFAALPLGLVWEWADRQRLILRGALVAAVALPLVFISYHNLSYYFRDYTHTNTARFVFFPEIKEASAYLDAHGHPYVYMYSDRATLGHEARQVLAPNIAGGEERSLQFTPPPYALRYDLAPAKTVDYPLTRPPDGAVFLFMGQYVNEAHNVQERYPGGTMSEVDSAQYHVVDYRAYYLPANLLDSYARRDGIVFHIPPK